MIEFSKEYNPDLQSKLAAKCLTFCELALNSKIPSLGLLRSTYGEEASIEWLKIQFGSLNDYAEQGVGMNSGQLHELCALYLGEYYYLNAAEVCFFIARVKTGKYGQFYGSVGAMKIMSAMVEYIKERRLSIESHDREAERARRQVEIENRKGCVSYSEYQDLKKRAENGDIEAIEKQNSK